MAVGQIQPQQGSIAITAAILVLGGWFAGPVSAAPERDTLCHENHEATLEISANTVSTTIEAVADDHLLKPRVAAAANEVFAESDNEALPEDAVDSESENDEAATPSLRPVSDNEPVPVRRQMYRKDI